METILLILFVLAILTLLLSVAFRTGSKKQTTLPPFPEHWRSLLDEQSVFYQELDTNGKTAFEKRIQAFLQQTRVTGVNTPVEELDKVLIGASAIIPIFSFPDWEYINLREVLLYPDSFNHDFEQEGADRSILGMVGEGALNGVMVLSQHELRQAFLNKTSKTNTAIHEFVHLVDKTDGTVDGIPEILMQRQYVLPWLQAMQKEIKKILADKSDINPYGATNEAEFFAVVAEYFFERPDLLERKNPELYQLLTSIFRQDSNRPA
ncbi:MAG TPA: zinc-dependent peptidase [Chitinophagaceae bacterium]|nr:zinc-dependent peptidase [Chitinophagaceae bacterium]HPH32112.1 zinc-dependent peptidase [Chitinophagaceae bacterium]HPN58058.1 zinc-dependent peptidase [Chitinophagaceae bacterium]